MFFQRDLLMRQIEALSRWLARRMLDDAKEQPPEHEIEAAAGLSLDVAATLPPNTIASLVDLQTSPEGPSRLLLLGLGLLARAEDGDDEILAERARSLVWRAVDARPELLTEDVHSLLRDA